MHVSAINLFYLTPLYTASYHHFHFFWSLYFVKLSLFPGSFFISCFLWVKSWALYQGVSRTDSYIPCPTLSQHLLEVPMWHLGISAKCSQSPSTVPNKMPSSVFINYLPRREGSSSANTMDMCTSSHPPARYVCEIWLLSIDSSNQYTQKPDHFPLLMHWWESRSHCYGRVHWTLLVLRVSQHHWRQHYSIQQQEKFMFMPRSGSVMIYSFFLSKCLLSYLIFSAYLILSLGSVTPQSLHIDT